MRDAEKTKRGWEISELEMGEGTCAMKAQVTQIFTLGLGGSHNSHFRLPQATATL